MGDDPGWRLFRARHSALLGRPDELAPPVDVGTRPHLGPSTRIRESFCPSTLVQLQATCDNRSPVAKVMSPFTWPCSGLRHADSVVAGCRAAGASVTGMGSASVLTVIRGPARHEARSTPAVRSRPRCAGTQGPMACRCRQTLGCQVSERATEPLSY